MWTSWLTSFFQLCSVEITCPSLAAIGATLANNGTCPISNKNVLSETAAAKTVQILNITDKWAQNLGLSAKTSFSGAILVVVPGVMGLAVYSPRMNPQMKSLSGTKFCEAVATAFRLSSFGR